jgi:hypothetical protein
MRYPFGHDANVVEQNRQGGNKPTGVVWDTSRLINGHTLLLGMSGSGKTYMLRDMIAHMQRQSPGTRFHIFDVDGDIRIPGASEVIFSEQTQYGLNPLHVNPDPHFGGVTRCIRNFIATINKASPTPLGVKQEAVVRNILLDVYRSRGFNPDNPDTWWVREGDEQLLSDGSDGRLYLDIPKAEKDEAKEFKVAFWDRDRECWWVPIEKYEGGITRWLPKTHGRSNPTVADVLAFARRLLKISFMGSDQEAVTKLEIFGKHVAAFRRREKEAARGGPPATDDPIAMAALDKARVKCIDSFIEFVNIQRTGDEFDSLIKYDSTDVLKSVVDRLEGLMATGIFKGTQPPFNPNSPVWTYKLNALEQPEQIMFVLFRLQALYAAARQHGEQDDVKHVFVLDEINRFVDDGAGILSTLSREARKFGVALIAAGQNAALPEGFLSSLATKVILGIDELYWPAAISKMRIDQKMLEFIRSHKTAAVQMKEKASTRTVWRPVNLLSATVQAPRPQSPQPLATAASAV